MPIIVSWALHTYWGKDTNVNNKHDILKPSTQTDVIKRTVFVWLEQLGRKSVLPNPSTTQVLDHESTRGLLLQISNLTVLSKWYN